MRHILFFLVLVACSTQETIKQATPREHLRGLIAGYEQGPGRAGLDKAPGDVVGGLIALASDPSEKRFYRARALTALGLYAEEERAYQFLSLTVQQPKTGLMERSSAVYALSLGWSTTRPDEVARLLSPLLQNEAPLIRKSATEALLQNPSPIAKEALQAVSQ